MSFRLKNLLVASALASLTALSASIAAAQTGSDEIQPMEIQELSQSSQAAVLSSFPWLRPGNLRPIREPAAGNKIIISPIDTGFASSSGKLHIRIDGENHWCSGAFVSDQVIVTAAHCVQRNGTSETYEIVDFVREGGDTYTLYGKDSDHEYGRCVDGSSAIKVPPGWSSITDPYLRIHHDFAFLTVNSPIDNRRVKIVGVEAYGRNIKAYGYPAANNQNLTAIEEPAKLDVLHPQLVAIYTKSLGFTEGTSGGAWVWNVGAGQPQTLPFRVFSVNSSYAVPIYDKSHIWIYGPNLAKTDARQLLVSAENCPPPQE